MDKDFADYTLEDIHAAMNNGGVPTHAVKATTAFIHLGGQKFTVFGSDHHGLTKRNVIVTELTTRSGNVIPVIY